MNLSRQEELYNDLKSGKLPDLKSMYLPELEQLLMGMGEKKFHAKQLFRWMHQRLAESIDEMSDLSKDLRSHLKSDTEFTVLKKVKEQVSADGTRKYLWELPDGNRIESVFMRYVHGNSVCISSQAGCAMGCAFCASAIGGLERNLTAAEMLEQVYRIQAGLGEHVDNVTIMGSGEPLMNLDNVYRFFKIINTPEGLNLSLRNITVSTSGIIPKMKELAAYKLPVTLAVSLHAPDDGIRSQIMPIAKKYPMDELLDTCAYYFKETGRRISFEYALMKDINDSEECAERLADKIKKLNCHVNLININPVTETKFKKTSENRLETFRKKLEKNLINVTIRRVLGQDIDGACGQLRRRFPLYESTS